MIADFVIVGGGPAGLAVAIEAARRGGRAVVVERCHGPVEKACGEGLQPEGVARLRALGVELPAWGTHPFRGIRYLDGDVVAQAEFLDGEGLGVRRLALEEGLRARAAALGVTLWEGTEATTWDESPSGVTLHTSRGPVRADWLVGADGLRSGVRRRAGFATRIGARARMGMRRHYTTRPWTPYVEVYWGDGLEAYVTPVGPERVGVAFLWSGEKGDHDAFLARMPALAARLGPAETTVRGAGPFEVHVATQARGRVLLVGDAAGYLDAVTGEGIALALGGAEALVSAVAAGHPEAWPAAWSRLTRRHFLLTRVLLEVARRPWLRRGVIRALAANPALFSLLVGVNSGIPRPWRALLGGRAYA